MKAAERAVGATVAEATAEVMVAAVRVEADCTHLKAQVAKVAGGWVAARAAVARAAARAAAETAEARAGARAAEAVPFQGRRVAGMEARAARAARAAAASAA